MTGVVLTLLTAVMHRQVQRRASARVFGEAGSRPGATVGAGPSGSSVNYTGSVGSDDSTAIRVRPIASTVDHPISGVPLNTERESASGRTARVE
jgi:hypothetical protein